MLTSSPRVRATRLQKSLAALATFLIAATAAVVPAVAAHADGDPTIVGPSQVSVAHLGWGVDYTVTGFDASTTVRWDLLDASDFAVEPGPSTPVVDGSGSILVRYNMDSTPQTFTIKVYGQDGEEATLALTTTEAKITRSQVYFTTAEWADGVDFALTGWSPDEAVAVKLEAYTYGGPVLATFNTVVDDHGDGTATITYPGASFGDTFQLTAQGTYENVATSAGAGTVPSGERAVVADPGYTVGELVDGITVSLVNAGPGAPTSLGIWSDTSGGIIEWVDANADLTGTATATIHAPGAQRGETYYLDWYSWMEGTRTTRPLTVEGPKVTAPAYAPASDWTGEGVEHILTGFTPGEAIDVDVEINGDFSHQTSPVADSEGTVSELVTVPGAVDGDQIVVTATDLSGASASHRAGVGVLDPAGPRLVAKSHYTVAEIINGVDLEFSGFGPGETVSGRLADHDGALQTPDFTVTADETGSGTVTIHCDAMWVDTFQFQLDGETSGLSLAHFFTTDPQTVVGPKYATQEEFDGAGVLYTFDGFYPDDEIDVKVAKNGEASEVVGQVTADHDGHAEYHLQLSGTADGDQLVVSGFGGGYDSTEQRTGVGPIPGPASIDTNSARFSVGAIGSGASMHFEGFGAGERVEYEVVTEPGGIPVGDGWADAMSDGSNGWVVTVPGAEAGEKYRINGLGRTSGLTATAVFGVEANPVEITSDLAADYTTSEVHSGVTLNAAGFWPLELVHVFVQDGGSTVADEYVTTDGEGEITSTFDIADAQVGDSYDVTVYGTEAGVAGYFSFGVTANPTAFAEHSQITIPESANPFLISFTGFRAGESVDVQIQVGGSTAYSATATASGTGTGSVSPVFGAGPAGSYTAVFTGDSGRTASTTFTIVAPAASTAESSYTPTEAAAGIRVEFSGFAPGETVDGSVVADTSGSRVAAAPGPVGTATGVADADGNGVMTVTIPDAAAGQYRLDLEGETSALTASIPLTIALGDGQGQGGGDQAGGDPDTTGLAFTGTDSVVLAATTALGLLLLLVGAGATLVGRHRRGNQA